MTKQEKIQEEWVNLFGEEKYNQIKHAITENGFIDCVKNPEVSKIINTCTNGISWGTTNYRPSNLKGLEKNNGWIKIESEDDLPKEDYGEYHVVTNENIRYTTIPNNQGTEEFWQKDRAKIDWWMLNVTHYQPIQKPQPPIF